jgi:hypothetical protein
MEKMLETWKYWLDKLNEPPKYSPWYYMLNGVLIKERKPCLPGERIHIYKWNGCYNVYHVNKNGFTIKKHGKDVTLPWDEFKFKKGGV